MTDARKLWTAGSTAPAHVDAKEIATRAAAFGRKTRHGILAENLAGVFVIFFFGYDVLFSLGRSTTLTRIGSGLIAGGCAFVLVYLNARGRPAPPRPEISSVAWYRAELERWHGLHRSIVRWYLGPFVPGLALFLAGMVPHATGHGSLAVLALVVLVVIATFAFIAWRNFVKARVLRAEIDALPAIDDP